MPAHAVAAEGAVSQLAPDTLTGWIILLSLAGVVLALLLQAPMVGPMLRVALWQAYRFAAGQVMFRPLSRWDARWESWAPELPETVSRMRSESYPRTRWARRPGWQRQLVRFGGIAVLWAYATAPVAVVVTAAVVIVTVLALRLLRSRIASRYAAVADPFDEPVAEKIGTAGVHPMHWLQLPRGSWESVPPVPSRWLTADGLSWMYGLPGGMRLAAGMGTAAWKLANAPVRLPRYRAPIPVSDADARIRLSYPKMFNGHAENVKEVQRLVTDRLPGEWEATHRPQQRVIEFYHPTKFPEKWEANCALFEDYSITEIPIGKDRRGEVVTIPLKAKTPHVSGAASTGWGKTTLANVILGNLLYHGACAVVLDPKRVGYTDAYRRLPNVRLRTTLRGQIEAISEVKAEMERRYEFIEQYQSTAIEQGMPSIKDNPELYFRPLILVDDEKGSLTTNIKEWWKKAQSEEWELQYKPEGKAGKGTPAPLMEQQIVLWQGRAAAVHVVTMAQQNNLDVFLNSDMRDQYMFRILQGPQTRSSWVMTFPGTRQKKLPTVKGRAVVGIGAEEQREVQIASMSDEEAREAALHGIGVADRDDAERAERLARAADRPLWEVSPLPAWLAAPAATAEGVPAQPAGTGQLALPPGPSARPELSVIDGQGQKTADQSMHISAETHLRAVSESSGNAISATAESRAGADSELAANSNTGANTEEGHIIGIEAAAEHLGLKPETFRTYRRRDRKKGIGIAGEVTRADSRPAWPALALEEWLAQEHPTTLRRVSGQD